MEDKLFVIIGTFFVTALDLTFALTNSDRISQYRDRNIKNADINKAD